MTATAHVAPRHLSTGDVCELAGCSYRQLDSWVRRGYITPTQRATGTGSARGWSPHAARHVVITTALVDVGLAPRLAARLARQLIRLGRVELREHLAITWDPPVGATADPRACIACGCTQTNPCPDGCTWWDPSVPICTRCIGAPEIAP